MKTKLFLFSLALFAWCAGFHQAFAQGTAFTYQGQLSAGGAPAGGLYDFSFTLYGTGTGGSPLANSVTNFGVPVSNGLFVVAIDFGNSFTNQTEWLQIAVRTNGGSSFTTLNPRQQLTPTPYSILSENASTASSVAAANITGTLLNGSLPSNAIFAGTVTATGFSGNGNGLTNLSASQLTGGMTIQTNTNNEPNIILGSSVNYVSAGVLGATISGGGEPGSTNRVTANGGSIGGGFNNNAASFNATVAGGINNTASGNASTVAGGSENTAGADHATVAGGQGNNNQGQYSTIGGGGQNSIASSSYYSVIAGGGFCIIGQGAYYASIGGGDNNANYASYGTLAGGVGNLIQSNTYYGTIGGGVNNSVTNDYGTVPGGYENVAGGQYSFAAGQRANATNQGAFVWADTQNPGFASTNNDSFNVRSQGGARFVTSGAGMTIDGQRVLTTGSTNSGISIQTNSSGAPNVVLGSSVNYVSNGVVGATISGGGATNYYGSPDTNIVTGDFGTIGGGFGNSAWIEATIAGGVLNSANGDSSTVSGGTGNQASGPDSTVGGGNANYASGDNATVSGGAINNASGWGAFIGGGGNFDNPLTVGNTASGGGSVVVGGSGNVASGNIIFACSTVGGGSGNWATNNYATVPGGYGNLAGGQYSFAAGRDAVATNQGAFVWADSQNASFSSTANDQFLIRAQGGVGINTAQTTDNNFCINNNTYLFSHALYLRGDTTSDHNHGLAYCGNTVTNFNSTLLPDGPVLWGYTGGALATRSGGTAMLAWNSTGVAINGTNNNGATFYTTANRNGGWPNSCAWFVNTNSTTTAAPALRVINNNASATNPDGALSVSIQGSGLIAEFGNSGAYVVTITNDGTIYSKGVALTSDRNAKENFTPLDSKAVLEKVSAMPVTQWNYKDDSADKKHIGPVAQDFQSAFGLNGGDDKHISVVDEAGVALAAIQGLNEKVEELNAELKHRDAENAELKARLDALEKSLARLR
ncbi:MAG TPA: tail fiber domain-containing protein [Verrucomicrobiae bacterium]|nr:tail fiber domain-containing protein [Verrucomicrobiae bacterium]